MKALKPLLYLTYKTVFNGLKRAVTTPRRLIYFIAFVAYYFFLFIRPSIMSSTQPHLPGRVAGALQFPPLEIIDAFAFGLFLFFSFILLIGIFGSQGQSRPADVDVLFPTPVSPKVVLGFRICRDYLFTLITPFLIAVLGLRATKMGWEAIFRNMPHPEYSSLTLRAITVSWILMAMCFVAINHALGLYINRTDRTGDRNKAMVWWVAGIYMFGWIAFIAWSISQNTTWNHVVQLAQWPVLRVAFFITTFGTELAMAPFYGSASRAILGAGGLIATTAFAMKLAMSQVSWFYDESAIRGFNSSRQRELQRAGDFSGMMAERARTGKFKVRRMMWLHRLRMSGPPALLWKEFFLQPRTVLPLIVFMVVMSIALSLVPSTIADEGRKAAGFMLLTMQGFLTMMATLLMGQTGFVEVLKRVDLQKALPFAPQVTVIYEIIGRSLIGIFGCWIGCVAFLIMTPSLWSYALAAAIGIPCLTVLLTSGIFFVTMLFPDVEDPSQRQFRALMMLLGIAITSFFPAGTMALLVLGLDVFPPLAALISSAIALALAALLAVLSGQLYATFNPSE